MNLKLVALVLSLSSPVFATDEPHQRIQISKTERFKFPPNGVLRLDNSIGEITIQGWDQDEMELTTTKSPKAGYDPREGERRSREFDSIQIATERHGDEIVVTTKYPRHRGLPPGSPVGGAANFNLQYDIKVPRTARLIIDHDVGEINLDDLSGDIQATALQGTIALHLPENVTYDIDAKSDWGNVTSDFPGREERRLWKIGHRIVQHSPNAAQRLHLRIGYGDIIILRIRKPLYPSPVSQ